MRRSSAGSGSPLSVAYGGQTERATGELVSGNYFRALGVGAAVERVIGPEDDRVAGGQPVAVLSFDYWVNRFAADPKMVGRDFNVNGHKLTVIGVSEKSFNGVEPGNSPSIRIPVTMKKEMTPGLWASCTAWRTGARAG